MLCMLRFHLEKKWHLSGLGFSSEASHRRRGRIKKFLISLHLMTSLSLSYIFLSLCGVSLKSRGYQN
jgi:hypothetical protein